MSKTKSAGSSTKGRSTNEGSYYDISKGTKPINRPKK